MSTFIVLLLVLLFKDWEYFWPVLIGGLILALLLNLPPSESLL